ncbi:PREDICTED: myosin-binding protein 3-like isoform X1 [Lupinus angustifolius]|uniref:myosin-binding protein 3-like isoform X1 n=1 Tax=Lupinus angustifolius TaxID=3871 RepID=UPI00092F4771|nr:PREDICTED: myosin-binding protein 3-like isoform X1 [Lupinus angustifolius]
MAGNKFATMLHRSTNKMVVNIVYAVLEWVLIVLLLLNSMFSYLITKFAKSVGLKPPCLWCSRVDHVLQPRESTNLHKDLVCETHAAEISRLGYCSNHQRLTETQSMCVDCLTSTPNHGENENIKRCSCCNESMSRKLYPTYLLMKPSWEHENFTSKGSLIVESIDDEKEGDRDLEFERKNGEDHDHDHHIFFDIESFILREVAEDRSSSFSNFHSDEKDAEKEDLIITELNQSDADNFIHQFTDTSMMQASFLEDRSLEVINMHFEHYVTCDTQRLIPVKLIDSITSEHFESSFKLDEDLGEMEQKVKSFATESPIEAQLIILEGASLLTMDNSANKISSRELESLDTGMTGLENFIVLDFEELKQDSVVEVQPQRITTDEAQTSPNKDNDVDTATKEPDNRQVDLPLSQEPVCSYECLQEDESSSSDDDAEVQNAFDEFIALNNLSRSESLSNGDNNGDVAIEEPNSTTRGQDKTDINNNEYTEMIEKTTSVAEDKLPETPSSFDGLHYLQKKLNLFEKRELGGEDSLDGSVASELECGDPVLTIDRLKTALKAEQRVLSTTYQELEDERSASAVATNQTMAMITRLQEEKAAMQMEALQYQRMMEEQAEYDQEALQLLNELMVKREKEKQELEMELEEYRLKVMDYEAKERVRVLKRMKDGSVRSKDSCSCSCSNVDYTDDHEISIDLNHETRDKDNCYEENGHNNATFDPVSNLEDMTLDCVKHISVLDNSFTEFEEERASILYQLKALEEKIISMEDNDEFLEDVNLIEHSSAYDEKNLDDKCNFRSPEENKYSNEFSDDKHSPRRTMGSLAKRLLPYLDAADNETKEEEAYSFDIRLRPESVDIQNSVPILEMENMKVSIEEEVDRVYERLQALETDREFLKHCLGSMQNGDKGVDLLQEILQHLRDLKTVEHCMKNSGNYPLE